MKDKLHVILSNVPCVLIVAFAAFTYSICLSCLPPRPSSECRAFYDLTPQVRVETIRGSTVERQLVLYECGMYQEPPTDYAGDLADGGEKIVPVVLDRLKAEKSETRQDHLIHVFEQLGLKGHLRGRRDIADRLSQVVSSMKNDEIKNASEKRLRVINENL